MYLDNKQYLCACRTKTNFQLIPYSTFTHDGFVYQKRNWKHAPLSCDHQHHSNILIHQCNFSLRSRKAFVNRIEKGEICSATLIFRALNSHAIRIQLWKSISQYTHTKKKAKTCRVRMRDAQYHLSLLRNISKLNTKIQKQFMLHNFHLYRQTYLYGGYGGKVMYAYINILKMLYNIYIS